MRRSEVGRYPIDRKIVCEREKNRIDKKRECLREMSPIVIY